MKISHIAVRAGGGRIELQVWNDEQYLLVPISRARALDLIADLVGVEREVAYHEKLLHKEGSNEKA